MPLYYSVNSFSLNSADEIINSWYQSEKVSIQQGNILSSISKLQRPIKKSILLKGIIVKNENGNNLLKMGQSFVIERHVQTSNHEPSHTRVGISSYVYQFSESGITVYILVGSSLPYLVTFFLALYLIILFLIFGYFIQREVTLIEKIRNEHELDSMKLKIELDKNFLIMSQQVAHDIRSPLAALNILSSQIKDSSNESIEVKNILNISIQRINDISSDLFKQFKNANTKLELKKVSIDELIENIVIEKNIILTNKNMNTISFDKEDFKNIVAEIIPSELSRVLSNLINNSVEAISSQTGIIKIKGHSDASTMTLVVSDNGKGIPSSVLSKIGVLGASFGKQNESDTGLGIGLYHAKKTIELFGGTLNIESEEDGGTRIILKFPCEIIEQENASASREMVLFEDDELVKISWEYKAKKIGVRLSVFSSFDAFMNTHQSVPFSLLTPIYSDVNLSTTESGLDVVNKLHNLGFLNINLCTGYNRNSIEVPSFIKLFLDKNFPIT